MTVGGRRPFRGTVLASAILFEDDYLSPEQARRRALAWWAPGATIRRSPWGLLLLLAEPRRVAVAQSPGLLLVARAGLLVGFDATAAELRALDVAPGNLVVSRGGEVQRFFPSEMVEPYTWIDLSRLRVIATRPLAQESLAPLDLTPPPPPRDVRSALGPSIPPASAAREAILREAAEKASGRGTAKSSDPGARRSPAATLSSWISWLTWPLTLLSRLLTLFPLARSLFRGRDEKGDARTCVETTPAPRLRPRAPWWQRLAARLQRGLGLQRLLGRRQGQYLAAFMDMLSRGDVAEGLRHAIPLRAMKDLLPEPLDEVPWTLPQPRDDLAISATRKPSRSTLHLANDLFAELRALYRATFERLEAQGRHEEAAFVLAELLQSDEEAVAYLERQGHFRRAAELAEARGCEPGLIVRAWFLAGDVARAVRIAREQGAFHAAVSRLTKTHPAEARLLRFSWADALADGGRYADAAALMATEVEGRALALRWIELGLAAEGPDAARLVVLQASLAPERWDDVTTRVAPWLMADDQDDGPDRRRALAEALLTAPNPRPLRRLARLCARPLVARVACDAAPLDDGVLNNLLQLAGAQDLAADLPRRDLRLPRGSDKRELFTAGVAPGGPAPVHDAVLLHNGRVLVAQGDAGVALLDRRGKLVCRFDCPAHRLVMSDAEDRAIALGTRGEATQLSQLDLVARTSRPWGVISLKGAATTYDGSLWYVFEPHRLLGLDTLSPLPRCCWAVNASQEDDTFQGLTRSPRGLTAFFGGFGAEWWHYELPGPTLRARRKLPWALEPTIVDGQPVPVIYLGAWASLDEPEVAYAAAWEFGGQDLRLARLGRAPVERRILLRDLPTEVPSTSAVASAQDFALAFSSSHADAEVRIFNHELELRAKLHFPESRAPQLRFSGRHLVMTAAQGRLAIFDTQRGTLRTVPVP